MSASSIFVPVACIIKYEISTYTSTKIPNNKSMIDVVSRRSLVNKTHVKVRNLISIMVESYQQFTI